MEFSPEEIVNIFLERKIYPDGCAYSDTDFVIKVESWKLPNGQHAVYSQGYGYYYCYIYSDTPDLKQILRDDSKGPYYINVLTHPDRSPERQFLTIREAKTWISGQGNGKYEIVPVELSQGSTK